MSLVIEQLILEAPTEYESIFMSAFPYVRQLIADDNFKSDSDENIFKRWYRDEIIPGIKQATEEVKESLRYCLEARGKAELAALAAGTNFICGFLPHYPGGLAPAVAALIVLTAYVLRDENLI